MVVDRQTATLFPPHARGWTDDGRRPPDGHAVSPARAGMDPEEKRWKTRSFSFPRTRGDGPHPYEEWKGYLELPPHARGWTAVLDCVTEHQRASPARAGMDPERFRSMPKVESFPRTRGDGPGSRILSASSSAFPPHARGWT